MSEKKFGTFENLLEITEKELHPIAIRLREIILELDLKACELVRLGDKSATFGIGPKKNEGRICLYPSL